MDVTDTRLTGVPRKERQPLTLNPSALSPFTNSWAAGPLHEATSRLRPLFSDRLPVVFGVAFRAIIGSVVITVIRLEHRSRNVPAYHFIEHAADES
jgi:hypothetical protein